MNNLDLAQGITRVFSKLLAFGIAIWAMQDLGAMAVKATPQDVIFPNPWAMLLVWMLWDQGKDG